MLIRSTCVSATLLALAACTASGPHAVTPATTAQKQALIDRIKSLEGEWEMPDETGARKTMSIFKVSSNGSVVREIMMPGSSHEMTNIYHMDGGDLILTHYCAQGNQPRMRAAAGDSNNIDFKLDSVTNWAGPSELYMGTMRLEIKDHNNIVEHWTHFEHGKAGGHADFEMTRKR